MLIKCFSISSTDQLDKVYILLNSLKQNKLKETNIEYHLLIDNDEKITLDYCEYYFKPLSSKEDFKIKIHNVRALMETMDKNLTKPFQMYLKCFAPSIFKEEEKILYLDSDMVFYNEGIEELWNTNIENQYAAVVEEPIVTYHMKQELKNTKVSRYFNSGVMLLNLKKIREDQLDKQLVKMITKWDNTKLKSKHHDQSLFNYLFKENVKFIDFKFNNTILVLTPAVLKPIKQFLKDQYNGISYGQSIANAVIIHFLGQNKPWKKEVREYDVKTHFPFKDTCIQIWDMLEKKYKRSGQYSYSPSRIKLIQYFVGNDEKYLELCKVSEQINKKYAQIHNYKYNFEYISQKTIKDYYGVCDYQKIIAYKVKLIYDHLMKKDNDILVFIDADAAVSNPTKQITDLIDDYHEIFLSRGNQKFAQISNINQINNEIKKIKQNEQILTKFYWDDIIKKYNLYSSMELLSIGCLLFNGGFYIIKNTELMRNLFKDCLILQELIIDTIYNSKGQDERTIGLCLLKQRYYPKHCFMYEQSQGGIANSYGTKYDEDKTFLLHDYGKATTKQQKINRMKDLLNNKWWKNYN